MSNGRFPLGVPTVEQSEQCSSGEAKQDKQEWAFPFLILSPRSGALYCREPVICTKMFADPKIHGGKSRDALILVGTPAEAVLRHPV